MFEDFDKLTSLTKLYWFFTSVTFEAIQSFLFILLLKLQANASQ